MHTAFVALQTRGTGDHCRPAKLVGLSEPGRSSPHHRCHSGPIRPSSSHLQAPPRSAPSVAGHPLACFLAAHSQARPLLSSEETSQTRLREQNVCSSSGWHQVDCLGSLWWLEPILALMGEQGFSSKERILCTSHEWKARVHTPCTHIRGIAGTDVISWKPSGGALQASGNGHAQTCMNGLAGRSLRDGYASRAGSGSLFWLLLLGTMAQACSWPKGQHCLLILKGCMVFWVQPSLWHERELACTGTARAQDRRAATQGTPAGSRQLTRSLSCLAPGSHALQSGINTALMVGEAVLDHHQLRDMSRTREWSHTADSAVSLLMAATVHF